MSGAIWRGVLCTLLVGGSGCGLALDLDPPDEREAGVLDAGDSLDGGIDSSVGPVDDAGARDAGDASAALDAGRVVDDAGERDAGSRDGGAATCTSSRECGTLELCQRAPGQCYGRGTCVVRPAACADAEPVCGCDWEEHASRCDALSSGVNTMHEGACPTRVFEREWCALVPMAPEDPAGCRGCFDDADCPGTLAPICVASSCHAGGEGICAFAVGIGDCFDARQCRDTETCVGSVIDVCPSVTGRCVAR